MKDNKFMDDMARMASSAIGTFAGMKNEIEAFMSQQMESMLKGANMVSREEFDAVRAMAAKAREEQEKLEKRVAALEAELKK